MLSIPLPFVVSFFLLVLLLRMVMTRRNTGVRPAALLFVAVCVLASAVVGLRWGVGLEIARLIQPVVASFLPSMAWISLVELAEDKPFRWRAVLPHLAPVVLVAMAALFWRPSLDVLLLVQFIGYGAALIRLAVPGPDALGAVRFTDAGTAVRAVSIVGALLIGSGLVDLAIAVDIEWGQGAHAPYIIASANLIFLVIGAIAVSLAGSSLPPSDALSEPTSSSSNAPEVSESDENILVALDDLMRKRRLFIDPDLTLDRLARRAIIPSRRISASINRVRGCNVSQWINEYRVAEARRLLAETDLPVTSIMFECGFQTKSNFNREFRRLNGQSPSAYRRALLSRSAMTSEN